MLKVLETTIGIILEVRNAIIKPIIKRETKRITTKHGKTGGRDLQTPTTSKTTSRMRFRN